MKTYPRRNQFEMACADFEVRWPTSEERKTYLEYLEFMDELRKFRADTLQSIKALETAINEL